MAQTDKCKELILRDELAIERTYLARERTILAYIRTSLALVGVALFFYKFMDMEDTLRTIFTGLMLIPGLAITLYGIYKAIVYRKERKIFVEGYHHKLK